MENNIDDLLELDACLLEEEQIFETIEALLDAIDRHPKNSELKLQLARCLSVIHREDESESLLRSILQSDPTHEPATLFLGRLLDNSDRSSEAEREYRFYLKRNPAGHLIVYELCRILLESERIEDAEMVAQNHLETHSSKHMAYEPILMVLSHKEEEIEEVAIDSNYKSSSLRRLLEIHLLQFDLLLDKERCADSEEASKSDDVTESLLRVTGEIMHLLDRAKSTRVKLPKKLSKRCREAVEEGMRRRRELEIV
ncbi:MAG: tetratricopeptide repeat protein [Candidatus Thorarchaeota archaeon]|nr:MAG: tetratricopeptide repeat protein [Candidatus Thorarchaeota archaeon]